MRLGFRKLGLVNDDQHDGDELHSHVQGSRSIPLYCDSRVDGEGRIPSNNQCLSASVYHGDGLTDLRLDTSTKLKLVNYWRY